MRPIEDLAQWECRNILGNDSMPMTEFKARLSKRFSDLTVGELDELLENLLDTDWLLSSRGRVWMSSDLD